MITTLGDRSSATADRIYHKYRLCQGRVDVMKNGSDMRTLIGMLPTSAGVSSVGDFVSICTGVGRVLCSIS